MPSRKGGHRRAPTGLGLAQRAEGAPWHGGWGLSSRSGDFEGVEIEAVGGGASVGAAPPVYANEVVRGAVLRRDFGPADFERAEVLRYDGESDGVVRPGRAEDASFDHDARDA